MMLGWPVFAVGAQRVGALQHRQAAQARAQEQAQAQQLPRSLDPDLLGGPGLREVMQLPPPRRARRPLTREERRQIDTELERRRLEIERVELQRRRELERRRIESPR
jgi:hypothetical protein